jgi:CheY-like chemotaxis protein
VMLVDVNLGAESGLELAEQLRSDGRSAPVILISTHAEQDFADMIAINPAVGLISKLALSSAAISASLVDPSATLSGQLVLPRSRGGAALMSATAAADRRSSSPTRSP